MLGIIPVLEPALALSAVFFRHGHKAAPGGEDHREQKEQYFFHLLFRFPFCFSCFVRLARIVAGRVMRVVAVFIPAFMFAVIVLDDDTAAAAAHHEAKREQEHQELFHVCLI